MRAIITGDRKFTDYSRISKKCIDVFIQLRNEGYRTDREALEIITSRAKGPESLAVLFAINNNINYKVIDVVNPGGIAPAYKKNQLMLDYALKDQYNVPVLIAFWNNTGIVVNDIVNKATWKNFKIFEIRY